MNIPIGWLIALTTAFGGFYWLGGEFKQLWVPEEYLIIFGAAFGALVASNKWRNLKNLFKAFGRIFVRAETNKTANLALLSLMYELLNTHKNSGIKVLDAAVTAPKSSALFAKYPDVLKNDRLVEFITDYFRMMANGDVTLAQLDAVMSQEIEVLNQESLEPSDSMVTLADSMPAFGIVAAIVGVIHTLASIKLGKSPGEIGESIAAALTGTLFGVFSAYALFAPIARILEQNAATNLRPFEAVKEILTAYYSNFSPLVAVEYGRKVLYTDQRPSMTELDASIRSKS
jgi:chemotaxis protein MotA